MRIAIAQVRGQMDDPPANASKAKMLINNTDVDLLIFPEMFATGYDKGCGRFADNMDAVFRNKVNTNVKNRKCHVLYGSPLLNDGKIYNCAVLSDGENEQMYRKIHLDAGAVFNEKDVFASGNEPKIFNCGGLKIGAAIGNDVMFGELFRWYAANDVDIIVCISAAAEQAMRRSAKVLQARCIENSVDIVFVNMVGPDPGHVMAGGSMYISSEGNIIESCTDSSDVRIVKLDEERIKASKEKRAFLKEIRKDIDWSV
ncbi:MAG: carbon-nitrogen hydrolase family protein [Methanomassiliicoccaceae archaeon]|nr:carbon-nitrogen hydrolase family protein [Methanomassiliicoccaceae archaeon]